ncbi:nuclear GTPase SLIP-GC-like [Carassius auratus]|uniref:Nuclear GTPase SLIP-GC-like n=1 Tax=Carassius auratus TaxID=7957 RepID=A0A6P6JY44_CARAU|nr:nuclear GTPase SLIP-GC-like [Carassius auratus]
MYAVVILHDSDELLVAPTNWLSEDKKQCYWPPFKSPEKCMEAVENRLEPSTGEKPWEKLAILFRSEYGTYEQAKEMQAEMSEQKEQPSQSALSGIFSHGTKRKLETCDSHTCAKLHPDPLSILVRFIAACLLLCCVLAGNPSFKQNTDMFILKSAKQIMMEVKIRIQNINSTDQTSIEQKNNILDAIAKMDKMDKDQRRKETIGVFGKTGQGKSSLLNAILGLNYFLPSGSFGACTSVVTQVEANLIDSNYTAEIDLISKEELENEITSTDNRTETVIERITALYGADAVKKTLEELKRDDKYAKIDNFLSTTTKTISHTEVSKEFTNDVAHYIKHGDWYWPLVKSVTIKIPNRRELLEHIVLVDLPGTGDCNKIRDDLWKTKLRECSSVWIVSNISRAIDDTDPWSIIQHCIQDLGPGGECRNIDFICTKTDDIDPEEYIGSVPHPEEQMSLDKNPTWCIIHRNNRAKELVKNKFKNLEIMKSKARFIIDVFTVSSKAYLNKIPHLEPAETEIKKLQDFLKNTNRRINRELTRDYVNEAKGVLSFIQSVQLDTDEKMVEKKAEVHEALLKNLEEALKELDCQLDSLSKILDQCLSKGVEESVEQCVNTKNSMIASVAPPDKRGFHRTLQALYKNKGFYWPKNRDKPLDLNMCLAKHMHDNIFEKFNLIFPVDDNMKTGKSVQEQIDKFSIIRNGSAYSSSSMLYHMENFIKTEETKVKVLLKREVVVRKKKIFSSIETTIQNRMTAGYEQAAKLKGDQAMKRRENKITETIDLLKHSMFEDAKMEVLNQFKDLKEHICKTLESELKRSVERSLSQTSRTPLIDVTGEIERLESLSRSVI